VAPKPVSWWKESASVPLKVAAAVTVVVGAIAAILGLTFRFEPSWEPCVGGSRASFTAASVFPNVSGGEFGEASGATPNQMRGATNASARGAEVRFLYTAQSLRGDLLELYATLVRVSPGGAPTGIDTDFDEAQQLEIVPHGCSESGGYDVFLVPIPKSNQHYRIVLELYRGQRVTALDRFQPRLALIETPVFQEG
jgi:hypothetical protein